MSSRIAVLVLACVLALVGCSGDDTLQVSTPDDGVQADFFYEIPAGAGLALDEGTPLEILPGSLTATIGETIEIVNLDDRGHLVGPWFVGAGETVRQTFITEGEFTGECTVHPSGQIKVTVVAA